MRALSLVAEKTTVVLGKSLRLTIRLEEVASDGLHQGWPSSKAKNHTRSIRSVSMTNTTIRAKPCISPP